MDLEKALIIPKAIKSKTIQLRKLNEMKCAIRTADPSQASVSGGPHAKSKLEEICADIDEIERDIHESIKEYKQYLKDLEKEIDKFRGVEHLFLRYRYLCGMSYRKIAQEMHYSIREIYYIRDKVCTKFHPNT